jgi:hypothetical protein
VHEAIGLDSHLKCDAAALARAEGLERNSMVGMECVERDDRRADWCLR